MAARRTRRITCCSLILPLPQYVNFAGVHGLWIPCGGSVAPWGGRLAGEEYEPDARPMSEVRARWAGGALSVFGSAAVEEGRQPSIVPQHSNISAWGQVQGKQQTL